jgi:hypothetical protein
VPNQRHVKPSTSASSLAGQLGLVFAQAEFDLTTWASGHPPLNLLALPYEHASQPLRRVDALSAAMRRTSELRGSVRLASGCSPRIDREMTPQSESP